MHTYLDANPVIYSVEMVAPYAAAVDARLARPGVIKVVSHLTRLECRVKPLRLNDRRLLQVYDRFFAGCRRVTMTRAVYDKAADIRAQYSSFRTLDALHPAAAVVHRCDVFLTNDQKLTKFVGITVEIV